MDLSEQLTMTFFDPSQDFPNSTELPSTDFYEYDYEYEADENGYRSSMFTDGTFCSVKWDILWSNYNPRVHYPLLLIICIVGCVTNVLNLFIFTRPVMRSPTNLLLSVLAVTDFLCVFRKTIDVSLSFYRQGRDQRTSYQLHVEDWINEICFYLFHTWSIYMTVVVALWRLLGILRPMQSRYWFSYKSATLVAAIFIGFATLLVPLLFVGSSLVELYTSASQREAKKNDPSYVITQTEFGGRLQFWIQGLLIKLVPCFVLIVCTVQLINSLRAAAKDRLALFGDRSSKSEPSNQSHDKNYERRRRNIRDGDTNIRGRAKQTAPRSALSLSITVDERNERRSVPSSATMEFMKTTKMLIVLLIIFLVTELPPGILAFCFGLINSRKFFVQCYLPIRSFLNLNEYVSSSVEFFIYFYMSSKFRQTFIQHFWIRDRTKPNYLGTIFTKFRLFCLFYTKSESSNASNENRSPTTTDEVVVHDF